MEYLVHRIFLDMHSVSSQITFRVKQGTTNRKIYITLREGGQPYQIANDSMASLSAAKPDGNPIFNQCEIVGNTIIYTFTEQTTAAEGVMDCEVNLFDQRGERIASPHFTIIVEKGVFYGDEIISTPEANMLNDLIDRAKAASAGAENAAANVEGIVTDIRNHVGDIKTHVDNNFANAFKRIMSGALVQADDVSPIDHNVACKVRSKNLFDDILDYTKTADAQWTYENGTLLVSYYYINKFIELEEGKTYTFSCKSTKTGGNGGGIYLRAYTSDKNNNEMLYYNVKQLSPTATFTVPRGYPLLRLTFYGDTTLSEYSATYTEIMLEEGSKATGYVPYVDVTPTTVKRCGKNLIPLFTSAYTYTYRNVVHTCDTISNTIRMNGTAEAGGGRTIFSSVAKPFRLVKGVTYTLQARLVSGVGSNFHCYLTGVEAESKVIVYCAANNSVTFTATEDLECFIGINQIGGIVYENAVVQFQVEVGENATSLETYRGTDIVPAANGTVEDMTSVYPNMTIYSDTANTVISCEYSRDSNKVYKELYDYLEGGGLTGPAARIADVKILANAWVGTASPYSQVVAVDTVTPNTQVDLTPSATQLAIFHNKDLAFVTENENGVITVYAIGQKPTNDYTIQATLTEVII